MIKLNVNAQAETITSEFNRAINEIKKNAEKGIAITELVFGKEIYSEVRCNINDYMQEHNVDFTWLSMSGPVGMQNSIPCGNGRLMKFKLKS